VGAVLLQDGEGGRRRGERGRHEAYGERRVCETDEQHARREGGGEGDEWVGAKVRPVRNRRHSF
jgi:hypothetical protein